MKNITLPQILLGFVLVFLSVVLGVKYLISDGPPDQTLVALISAIVTAIISTAANQARKKTDKEMADDDEAHETDKKKPAKVKKEENGDQ